MSARSRLSTAGRPPLARPGHRAVLPIGGRRCRHGRLLLSAHDHLRGWGILAVLIGGICAGLGAAVSSANPSLAPIFVGLMLIGGGVGTWFLGDWLNQKRPVAEFDGWFARRREEVAAQVRGGAYDNVADPQRPGQLADPWAVGEYVLQQESARVRSALTNRHSLFFIPMQYLAFPMGAIGILVMIVGAFRG